jgi:hypothetical protein
MLKGKVERYQRKYAHKLAREDMVDMVLKWECSASGSQPLRLLPDNELVYVRIAVRCLLTLMRIVAHLAAAQLPL